MPTIAQWLFLDQSVMDWEVFVGCTGSFCETMHVHTCELKNFMNLFYLSGPHPVS